MGYYWSSEDLKIMSKCRQYLIDNNAQKDSPNISNSSIQQEKKYLVRVSSTVTKLDFYVS